MKSKGIVYLVGAGPGDVGLLTVRGAELLARADVVVYDGLVNTELLRLVPPGAEVIYGGKRGRGLALAQDELNALLIAKANEGKSVVRLKGGDPYIFGRGGEEAEGLASAGVEFEVVPGISSFVAGPSYAGIPLTHREHASAFMVITGHEDPDKTESLVDWELVAKMPGTKVVLMGVDRIRRWTEALMAGGMPGETPVAMTRWGTTGQQQSIEGTLRTIADQVTDKQITSPAVIVIGDVVKLRKKLNWFEQRPLFGQRIVVTRARDQAGELTRELTERGAEVLEVPTIRFEPPDDPVALQEAVEGITEYDWLIFTSANGVSAFFERFIQIRHDLREVGPVRIAAVGPATAQRVRDFHLIVDLIPKDHLARNLVPALKEFQSLDNLRICLLRAQVANRELPKALEDLGAIVDEIPCYKTVPENEDPTGAAGKLMESGADWITFTSGSTVEQFHARFPLPDLLSRFPQLRLATIGPETTRALQKLELEPQVQARVHTIAGLVEALEKAVRRPHRT